MLTDFTSRNNKSSTTWATPSNHLRNVSALGTNQLPWQTITALNATNGNINNNNIYNKLLYGIRPTQNGPLNKLMDVPKEYIYKSENFQDISLQRPLAAGHAARDTGYPRQ